MYTTSKSPSCAFYHFNVISPLPRFRKTHCVSLIAQVSKNAPWVMQKNVLFFDVEKKRRSKEVMLACRQIPPALPFPKNQHSAFGCQDTNWGVKGSYEAGRRSRTSLVSQTSQKMFVLNEFFSHHFLLSASCMLMSLHICPHSF